MTENELQEVLVESQGAVGDRSDGMRALERLKSKFAANCMERESPLPSSSKLQCTKVPERLRSAEKGSDDNHDCYIPKLISLGPYHHGKPGLDVGEKLKLNLAEVYIQDCEPSLDEMYSSIRGIISKLRGCYDEESTKKYDDDQLTVMMLVDGCALLCYILFACYGYDHEHIIIRYQDISDLHRDALLLENQLPYQLLLELLKMVGLTESANDFITAMFQEFFGINDEPIFQEFMGMKSNDSFLKKMMKNYCCPGRLKDPAKSKQPSAADGFNESPKPCHHLLDLFRRNFLGEERSSTSSGSLTSNEGTESGASPSSKIAAVKAGEDKVKHVKEVMGSFRNVKELMDAGIRIKRSPTHHLRDISFRSNGITACLRIPSITIDSSTKSMFLNLIAYEMSSDVKPDFISYLRFLDSLIDHADDVKELQSIGILQNNLGTHEEVAQFFNTVSANLESNFHAYKDVRVKIRKHLQSHYNSKAKMWMTQCLDTYFSSPWTIIAWLGAAVALFLTFVQTYYAVFPH